MDSIILLLNGCFLVPDRSSSSVSLVTPNKCPDKPQTVLKKEKIKSLTLSQQPITTAEIVPKDKAIGYIFTGKSKQSIKYKTKDDICVWIYDPDQQLLNNTELQKDGIYTIQISSSQGSGSFQMEISLESSGGSLQSDSSSSTTSKILSPELIIKQFYHAINQSDYETAWNLYTKTHQDNRQFHPDGYNSALQWWKQIKYIKISQIQVIKNTSDQATVEVEAVYEMRSRKLIFQSLQYFLVWNQGTNQWQINQIQRVKLN